MPYTNLTALKNIVPEADLIALTDDNNTGVVDTAVLDEAILNADSLIDSFLRVKYELPLTSTPQLVKKVSADLTLFNLYERRNAAKVPEYIQAKKKEAFELLEKLRGGEIAVDASDAEGHGGEYRSNKTAMDRQFTQANTWDKY